MKEENNPTLYKQQRLKHHEHLRLLKPEIILYFDKRLKIFSPRAKRDNRSNNMVTRGSKLQPKPPLYLRNRLTQVYQKLGLGRV